MKKKTKRYKYLQFCEIAGCGNVAITIDRLGLKVCKNHLDK